MKIKVDKEGCTGHARCWHYASDVYDIDDNGYSTLCGKIVDVPAEQEELARLGVENCPEHAITIIEE